jgi:membrane-bound inhibitor of C-type lysozyme
MLKMIGLSTGIISWIAMATAAPTNAQSTYHYQCSEKGSFTVSYSSTEAILQLSDGKALRMRQIPSASGTRYQNSVYILWTKGSEAFLDVNDKQLYKNCTTRPVSVPKP